MRLRFITVVMTVILMPLVLVTFAFLVFMALYRAAQRTAGAVNDPVVGSGFRRERAVRSIPSVI